MKPGEQAEGPRFGGLTEIAQVGDTIRRTAGEWTPTVQALLAHLHAVGFTAAPRPLGRDEQGREVLQFIAGGGPTHSDQELVRIAEMIAALHEATRSFTQRPHAHWQFMVGAPREGDVICHNDLSPDNTIYHPSGTPRAFIDWDLAAPAPPMWDLAWAAYRFIPLYDDATCRRLGYPIPSRPQRLRLLCDTYGINEPERLLQTVCERIRVLYETASAWGQAGRPGWREVWRDTAGQQWLAGLNYVEAQRPAWIKQLA